MIWVFPAHTGYGERIQLKDSGAIFKGTQQLLQTEDFALFVFNLFFFSKHQATLKEKNSFL